MYDWHQYNEKLVRRGEILISDDVLQNWDKELAAMNRKKEGRRFVFPESFMKIVGYARVYFGLPYRQTEGLLRTYGNTIPKIPDYTAIHKRVNRLDIRINPKVGNDIVIAVDSTGIKVANRGEWRRQAWQMRRRFLKIHVGVDIDSKKIVALKVTNDRTYDGIHLSSLVKSAQKRAHVTKVLADAAYDAKYNFSYLCHYNIVPGIKVKNNPYTTAGQNHPRRIHASLQHSNYKRWCHSVSYGKRWIIESVFSAFKRTFGEYVMAHKRQNMEKELALKVSLYNRFMGG